MLIHTISQIALFIYNIIWYIFSPPMLAWPRNISSQDRQNEDGEMFMFQTRHRDKGRDMMKATTIIAFNLGFIPSVEEKGYFILDLILSWRDDVSLCF